MPDPHYLPSLILSMPIMYPSHQPQTPFFTPSLMSVNVLITVVAIPPLLHSLWAGVHHGSTLLAPHLAKDHGADPGDSHQTSNNTVYNPAWLGAVAPIVRELESKSTVDDAKGDSNAAKPDVTIRPYCTRTNPLEHCVVHPAKCRHEEDGSEQDYTNDGVVVVEEVRFGGEAYTETEASNVDYVGKNLESSMEPDNAREGSKTDSNGASREEDDKGERSEDAVGDELPPSAAPVGGADRCCTRVAGSTVAVTVEKRVRL